MGYLSSLDVPGVFLGVFGNTTLHSRCFAKKQPAIVGAVADRCPDHKRPSEMVPPEPFDGFVLRQAQLIV